MFLPSGIYLSDNLGGGAATGYVAYGVISDDGEGQRENILSFETVAYGGSYENHECVVIEDSEEWDSVWLLARPPTSPETPQPEVNFSVHTVIAAFMGGQLSTGYAVSIDNVVSMENEIVVNVRENYVGGALSSGGLLLILPT